MSRTLALLENLHVFRGLTKREIAAIAKISVPVSYNAGKTVFVETSKGNDLYVILNGKKLHALFEKNHHIGYVVMFNLAQDYL